jgi:hypothetical protein
VKRGRILTPITALERPRLQNHDLGAPLPQFARLLPAVLQPYSKNTPINNLLKKTAAHNHWYAYTAGKHFFACDLPIF